MSVFMEKSKGAPCKVPQTKKSLWFHGSQPTLTLIFEQALWLGG